MKKATIAVITYMRPLWLNRLLEALTAQELNDNCVVDILVVDNACDSETKRIVDIAAKKSPIKITYETEISRGIVFARNRCVEIFLESDSENLIFIDDDEWPKHRNWVQKMLEKKNSYSADIVTSHVCSVGEKGTPGWAVKLIYGENKFNEGDVVKVFYTNNLLISRKVLERISPAFDSRFAMTGASDYHFALKCINKGFRAVYVDAPVIEEFPTSRANINWFVKRGFRSGIGFTRSHLFEDNLISAITRSFIMSVVRSIRGLVLMVFGCLTLSKLKIVSGIFRISSSVGTLAGFLGIKYREYNRTHGK